MSKSKVKRDKIGPNLHTTFKAERKLYELKLQLAIRVRGGTIAEMSSGGFTDDNDQLDFMVLGKAQSNGRRPRSGVQVKSTSFESAPGSYTFCWPQIYVDVDVMAFHIIPLGLWYFIEPAKLNGTKSITISVNKPTTTRKRKISFDDQGRDAWHLLGI